MKHTLALSACLAAALAAVLAAWWVARKPVFDAVDVVSARDVRAGAKHNGAEELQRPDVDSSRADGESSATQRVAATDAARSREAAPRRVGTDVVGSVLQRQGTYRKVLGVVLHFSGPLGVEAGGVEAGGTEAGRVETALASDGEYFVPALKAGRWHVTARVAGYAPFATDVEVLDQAIAQRIDFMLDRLPHLKIRMLAPNGEEITHALELQRKAGAKFGDTSGASKPRPKLELLAVATASPPGDRLAATLEDGYESYGRGTYRPFSPADSDEADIADKYSGILELVQPLPAYVSATLADVVLQTQFVPWNAEEVVFHLSTAELEGNVGSLRLRIVDADTGRPITKGRVGLHANGKFGTGLEVIDVNGYVVFDAESPGPRNLSIVASGYEWVVEQVRIDAGHVTDLGTYRLNRPISISGEVVDEHGRPVRAWVSVWPLERYEGSLRINEHFCWRADENGRFRISPAGRRKYVVRLNDDDWSGDPIVVDASAGSVQGVKLCARTSSNVSVSFDPETPRGARLSVTDAHGLPVAERAVEPKHKVSVRLAPGRYRLAVALGNEFFGERSVAVGTWPIDVSFGP